MILENSKYHDIMTLVKYVKLKENNQHVLNNFTNLIGNFPFKIARLFQECRSYYHILRKRTLKPMPHFKTNTLVSCTISSYHMKMSNTLESSSHVAFRYSSNKNLDSFNFCIRNSNNIYFDAMQCHVDC